MQISRFDGGLSTRIDPSLIGDNEAVQYTNVDNTKLTLTSIKGITELTQEVNGYFYNFKDTWLSSANERSYVEYKDSLYYTEVNEKPKKFNGFQIANLGIAAPTAKLTATQADPVATEKISASPSTLQYVYTYYNSEDGTESAPSPISDELSLAADKVVDLTGFLASDDPQVDKFRIYRIGDGITTMTMVKEIDPTVATVRDDTLTLDLEGTILDTYNNLPPPEGLQHLIEAYGILFGILDDKVYFTAIGEPNYWPAANFLDFSSGLAGLLAIQDGILVFSANKTDIIVGTTSDTFAKRPLSTEQGTVSHLSGKIVKSTPVWVSKNGICAYNAGSIQVLSLDKLDQITFNVVNTAVYNEQYFICLSDGSFVIMDVRFGLVFKKIILDKAIANVLAYNNTLYGRVLNKLVTLYTGDLVEFKYTSPNFIDAAHSVTKLYNNIYIRANGEFIVKVYIDGSEVLHKVLKGNKVHDIAPPQEQQRGSSLQFYIKGVGTIYEIDYKIVGRQNGR